MSRQYDEYIEGSFELYGERHWLVEPTTFEELLKAYEVRDLIQEGWSGLMHDEDSSGWETLMQEQEDYIQEFIDNRADFDNGILMKNLAFLLKKYNLKMGDLEKILGISAGYISRTAKENSAKKLSIDVVWKIAELFEISVDKLISDDISELSGNIGMLVDFMDKLHRQTECVDIEWDNWGGVHGETDETFDQLGLFAREEDGSVRYSAPGRNQEVSVLLLCERCPKYLWVRYRVNLPVNLSSLSLFLSEWIRSPRYTMILCLCGRLRILRLMQERRCSILMMNHSVLWIIMPRRYTERRKNTSWMSRFPQTCVSLLQDIWGRQVIRSDAKISCP